ncbi:Bone Morphogenetic Protein Receptor Type-2 [Manis pentadactyla]|nr:Bone Morphogenetic Protein Receptor Type-2 [Manis pentadactyla]
MFLKCGWLWNPLENVLVEILDPIQKTLREQSRRVRPCSADRLLDDALCCVQKLLLSCNFRKPSMSYLCSALILFIHCACVSVLAVLLTIQTFFFQVLQHSRPQALHQDGKKTLCSSTRAQVGSRLLWGQEAQVIGEWSAWSREPVRNCPLL